MNRVSIGPVALFCLLAFATSAPAECAWILWRQSPYGWVAYAGFSTRDECLKRARDPVEDKASKSAGTPLECFPDTIDPRGPKGK